MQSPNSYFMDVKCPGMFPVCNCKICHVSQTYGSFFSFRLLRHHDRLLARTNSSCLFFMHECAMPTYRRKDKTDRGCVAFLSHTDPLTYSGSQVAHSVEKTDFRSLISFSLSYVNHTHTLLRMFYSHYLFSHFFPLVLAV